MEVTQLSKTYNVRCLQDADIERICTLCSGNPQYYRYHPPAVTADSIREDSQCFALSSRNRSVARSCHSSQGGVVHR